MKKRITILATALFLITLSTFAQTKLKEVKAGNIFQVSLPEDMMKTIGLNNSATLQYKSTLKDVYGFVIEENKEELILAALNFTSINDFYEDFIKDFLTDEKKRTLANPEYKQIDGINFIENDVTYYDKEAKTEIYYLIGIVETKTTYYKVLSWTTLENKDKFKEDFRKIIYSLRD